MPRASFGNLSLVDVKDVDNAKPRKSLMGCPRNQALLANPEDLLLLCLMTPQGTRWPATCGEHGM
jgi:hypothetical protein